jgi:hypothetical protein
VKGQAGNRLAENHINASQDEDFNVKKFGSLMERHQKGNVVDALRKPSHAPRFQRSLALKIEKWRLDRRP